MILLVDVGNTRIKWLLADAGLELGTSAVNDGVDLVSGSVVHGGLSNLTSGLMKEWCKLKSVDQVVVSSVARGEVLKAVRKATENLWGLVLTVATVEKKLAGVRNAYEALDQLGVDRWMAAVGARASYDNEALIVVDVGTAINIELIVGEKYQGGVILPGIASMHDTLVNSAFGVNSLVDLPKQIVGKSTMECVNSGVYFGLAGAVDRVVVEMKQAIRHEAVIIICGGGAKVLKEFIKTDVVVDDNLVFKGLLKRAECEY